MYVVKCSIQDTGLYLIIMSIEYDHDFSRQLQVQSEIKSALCSKSRISLNAVRGHRTSRTIIAGSPLTPRPAMIRCLKSLLSASDRLPARSVVPAASRSLHTALTRLNTNTTNSFSEHQDTKPQYASHKTFVGPHLCHQQNRVPSATAATSHGASQDRVRDFPSPHLNLQDSRAIRSRVRLISSSAWALPAPQSPQCTSAVPITVPVTFTGNSFSTRTYGGDATSSASRGDEKDECRPSEESQLCSNTPSESAPAEGGLDAGGYHISPTSITSSTAVADANDILRVRLHETKS